MARAVFLAIFCCAAACLTGCTQKDQGRSANGARYGVDGTHPAGDVSASGSTPPSGPGPGQPGPDQVPPEAASDAGAPIATAYGADASARDADVAAISCGYISAESLLAPEAGTGTISGCAPRTCQGDTLPANQDPSAAEQFPPRLAQLTGCTTIEGDLVISGVTQASLPELSCLEHITGQLLIWNDPGLVSLHGLESLVRVGGDVGIGFYSNSYVDNPALVELSALSHLRVIGGQLMFGGGAAFRSLAGLDALEVIGGRMMLSFVHGASDLSGMNALRTIGGSLELWRPEGLSAISGLRSLRAIGGTLRVWGATDLVTLSGFPSLECLGGGVDIGGINSWEQNVKLTHIAAFPKLSRIEGDVGIDAHPQLTSFELLDSVRDVAGIVSVTDNPRLSECPIDAWVAARQAEGQNAYAMLSGNIACQGATP